MVDMENGLRSQACREIIDHYASFKKQAEQLGSRSLAILASDTIAHAYVLARVKHHDFVQLPELHPERYDQQAREEISRQAKRNHRLGLLQIFVERGVSETTAETLVDREILFV